MNKNLLLTVLLSMGFIGTAKADLVSLDQTVEYIQKGKAEGMPEYSEKEIRNMALFYRKACVAKQEG
jgi:hypothetical protein